jgi:integrase
VTNHSLITHTAQHTTNHHNTFDSLILNTDRKTINHKSMAVFEKRTSQNGALSYRVKVRIKGYPTQSKTFRRLTDARRWAKQTEVAIIEGRHFPKREAQKHTLNDAINRYRETFLPKKGLAMQDAQGRQLRWWAKELGVYLLADITPALISQARDKLMSQTIANGRKRSPTTGNRYIAAIGHLFSVAAREWQWIDDNPVLRIRRFKEPSGRTRFLNEEEKIRLFTECKASNCPYLYLIVLIAISTGMRYNEILTLTWQQINFPDQSLLLHKTKNEESRRVPIQGEALKELQLHAETKQPGTDLVFPSTKKPHIAYDIHSAWKAARKRARLDDFRFHDLRHTAASYYAMSGATARDLCDIFGWKKMQMAMRYAHLFESHTNELAAKMNEKFISGVKST